MGGKARMSEGSATSRHSMWTIIKKKGNKVKGVREVKEVRLPRNLKKIKKHTGANKKRWLKMDTCTPF